MNYATMTHSWNDWDTFKAFPFTHQFMTSLFLSQEEFGRVYEGQPVENKKLMQLFKWMADYRKELSTGKPVKSPRLLVLQGPPARGKTLLTNWYMRSLFGDVRDVTDLFAGECSWNPEPENVKLMVVTAGMVLAELKPWDGAAFSRRVRDYAMTGRMTFSEKFKKDKHVTLTTRMVATLRDNDVCPWTAKELGRAGLFLSMSSAKSSLMPISYVELKRRIGGELLAFAQWIDTGVV